MKNEFVDISLCCNCGQLNHSSGKQQKYFTSDTELNEEIDKCENAHRSAGVKSKHWSIDIERSSWCTCIVHVVHSVWIGNLSAWSIHDVKCWTNLYVSHKFFPYSWMGCISLHFGHLPEREWISLNLMKIACFCGGSVHHLYRVRVCVKANRVWRKMCHPTIPCKLMPLSFTHPISNTLYFDDFSHTTTLKHILRV